MKGLLIVLFAVLILAAGFARAQPPCPQTVAWGAIEGELVGYELHLDNVLVHTARINRGEVCIEDTLTHTLLIRAIHTDGTIEDNTNTGTAEELTIAPSTAPPIYGTAHPDVATCSDFKGNGRTGYGDFGTFVSVAFGLCNNGIQEKVCE